MESSNCSLLWVTSVTWPVFSSFIHNGTRTILLFIFLSLPKGIFYYWFERNIDHCLLYPCSLTTACFAKFSSQAGSFLPDYLPHVFKTAQMSPPPQTSMTSPRVPRANIQRPLYDHCTRVRSPHWNRSFLKTMLIRSVFISLSEPMNSAFYHAHYKH